MNYFVFVVCGAKTHIDTLNLSLRFLRHFSRYPILVVTDTRRNEIPVEHDNIIHVNTPDEYDHHQASIYLKTGLHRFVPDIQNDTYCYLDSDIIAMSDSCNQIFNYKPEPIIFAQDHCSFWEFSPNAMNCNCISDFNSRKHEFEKAMFSYFEDFKPLNEKTYAELEKLNMVFNRLKKQPYKNLRLLIKYLVSRYMPVKNDIILAGFRFNKKNRCWYDTDGNMISFDNRYHKSRLWEQQHIYFKNGVWYNKNLEDITPKTLHCEHLSDFIKFKYGIAIPSQWRHWNGGVFVFNISSVKFIDYWHRITMEEFKDPRTKTRDQATLAISAWKFNIQNMNTLPVKYNFIAEYNNANIRWNDEKGYTFNGFKSIFEPVMLHVYHHWDDTSWDIWQSVIRLAEKNNIQIGAKSF